MPRGTHHWFDLCGERRIRAIRLFQDVSGWTPHYTASGLDAGSSPCASARDTCRRRPRAGALDPAASVRAILLDIEGTTTPLAFVAEVLFPYARRALRGFLNEHPGELFDEWNERVTPERVEPIAQLVESLMNRDSKSTTLKALQGRIWEDGYRRGDLVGEVFDDVRPAFERWRAQGVKIGIFSSGSVLAQQLLFRHSSAGDLTSFLDWHFDTTIGTKTEADSYRRIAAAMELPPHAVLFVSDVAAELAAAREAGMQTRLSIRMGNKPAADHRFQPIRNFDSLVVTT